MENRKGRFSEDELSKIHFKAMEDLRNGKITDKEFLRISDGIKKYKERSIIEEEKEKESVLQSRELKSEKTQTDVSKTVLLTITKVLITSIIVGLIITPATYFVKEGKRDYYSSSIGYGFPYSWKYVIKAKPEITYYIINYKEDRIYKHQVSSDKYIDFLFYPFPNSKAEKELGCDESYQLIDDECVNSFIDIRNSILDVIIWSIIVGIILIVREAIKK